MPKTASLVTALMVILYIDATIAETIIKDNGYRGLVVAIDENIPENRLLLESIKAMITQASPILYKSTKQRAYFEQATIVVPTSWSSSPEYQLVSNYNYMDLAEIRVAPPHPSYNNIPSTLQLGGCGERGQYIHFTPELLLEISPDTETLQHRRNSKIFVHEWAHLRYGVFSEYGEKGSRNHPVFYKDKDGKIRPNGCTSNMTGWIRRSDGKSPCVIDKNKNLISDCTFYPDPKTGIELGTGKVSLMYTPEFETAEEFCDDKSENNRHNPSAPNMHNQMCNTRSVLDVILSNADFKNERNPPRDISNLTTEITVIQQSGIKSTTNVVLVLDISGSMAGKRLTAMQMATSRFIKYHIKNKCNIALGMVQFSYTGKVLANLTQVNNTTREALIKQVPKYLGGGTCIADGILKGIKVLSSNGDSTLKSKMILLTDGEETAAPAVKDIASEIKQSGVIIYTLAIGNEASKLLEEISTLTGGKAYFSDPDTEEISMDSILNAIMIDIGCNKMLPIMSTNRAFMMNTSKIIEGFFHVDKGVGTTNVFISYTYLKGTGNAPKASIMDPKGKLFNHESPEYMADANLRSIQFEIPQAQPGEWKYYLENTNANDIVGNVMVTFETNKGKPVHVKCWISDTNITYPHVAKMYAQVTKDNLPVIRESVVATGYRPDGKEEKIILYDNGKGADAHANDGVFTEYFTSYNKSGRYAIDINVKSTADTRLSSRYDITTARVPVLPISPTADLQQVQEVFVTSSSHDSISPTVTDFDTMDLVDDFERFCSAGTFVLNDWTTKDRVPPGRVTDLTVVASSFSERTIHLRWTSPDDMHAGQATLIELKYHHDSAFLVRSFEQSLSNFTFVIGNLLPLPAYEMHAVLIQLPIENYLYINNSTRNLFFAVRAIDEENNVGEVSNVALANFPISQKFVSTTESMPCTMHSYMIYVIVIIVVSFVVVIAILIICIVHIRNKQKGQYV